MTPERTRLVIAIISSLVIGYFTGTRFPRERFGINVVPQVGPIRIDKRTGETWQYSTDKSDEMVWKPIRIE